MDRLIEGYRRFRDGYYAQNRHLFEALAKGGQRPTKMIIGCSDARVDPAITFDTAPGDVFMVRNVANVVPPYLPDGGYHGTSAAIEFAVRRLEVKNIIVLGHARCGGIDALMRMSPGAHNTDFIEPWMSVAAPARARALEQADHEGRSHDHAHSCHLAELEGVKVSLANLMTFPWVSQRIEAGLLEVHGWYFDITKGTLWRLGRDGQYSPVV